MTYTLYAYNGEGNLVCKMNTKVSRNAKTVTVFKKCMNTLGLELIKLGIINENTKYSCELPNIWTNGYLGCAWFTDPYISVAIQEETGAWLAN